MKVWIARDNNKELFLYTTEPFWNGAEWGVNGWLGSSSDLPFDEFPEIKNGECFEAEITLGAKVK